VPANTPGFSVRIGPGKRESHIFGPAAHQYRVSDFLTVLDAERTMLQAQDQLEQSETATATTLVAVYKALGSGWQ
jgi:hypothetical protein